MTFDPISPKPFRGSKEAILFLKYEQLLINAMTYEKDRRAEHKIKNAWEEVRKARKEFLARLREISPGA